MGFSGKLSRNLGFVLALVWAAQTGALAGNRDVIPLPQPRPSTAPSPLPSPEPPEPKEPVYRFHSPVLQVGSTYENEGANQKVTEFGAGTVVDIQYSMNASSFDRGCWPMYDCYAVLTAAHLVQGDNPWVRIPWVKPWDQWDADSMPDQRVAARIVMIDPVKDIAILQVHRRYQPELPKPAMTLYAHLRNTYGATSYEDGPGVEQRNLFDCLTVGTDTGATVEVQGHYRACAAVSPQDELHRIPFAAAGDWQHKPLAVILSPSWALPGEEAGVPPPGSSDGSLDKSLGEGRPVSRTLGTGSMVVSAVSPGGNSGSIAVAPDRLNRFLGIPISYNYFFRHTTLATPESVRELMQKLTVAKAPWKEVAEPKEHWRMANGLLYLDFGDGVRDIDLSRGLAGRGIVEKSGGTTAPPGGTTAPPGGTTAPPGGTTAPPGGTTAPPGGTTAPPGGTTAPPGGTTAPPGNPCIKGVSETAAVHLQGDVEDATRILLGKENALDPEEIFRTHGITPYMSKDGKPLYGFEVTDLRKNLRITVYPNVEGYAYLRKLQANPETAKNYSIRPLLEPPKFSQLLADKRLAQDLDNGRTIETRTTGVFEGRPFVTGATTPGWKFVTKDQVVAPPSRGVLYSAALWHGTASIESIPASSDGTPKTRIRWKLYEVDDSAKKSLGTEPTKACVISKNALAEVLKDEVVVEVDEQGRVDGRKAFRPIVKVTSRQGKQFYLDLRPLFYTDLSIVYPSDSGRDADLDRAPDLAEKAGLMGLELREAYGPGDLQRERVIQFNTAQKPPTDGSIHCDSFEQTRE